MRATSQFGLFSPTNGRSSAEAAPFRELLQLLDLFVEANHKHLLNQHRFDVVRKTKFLAPLYRAKAKAKDNTSRFESYLKNFVDEFKNDPKLKLTIALYKKLLLTYQKTKIILCELNTNARQKPSSSMHSLIAELKPHFDLNLKLHQEWLNRFNALNTTQEEPAPNETLTLAEEPTLETRLNETLGLTEKQTALEILQATLMHCINNHTSKDSLAWHPSHYENYYLAKLKVLRYNYEEQYGPLDQDKLVSTVVASTAEEKREAIIAKHTEAQHTLASQKAQHSQNSLERQEKKLQELRDKKLAAIEAAQDELFEHTHEIVSTAADMSSPKAIAIFNAAAEEVRRKEIAFSSSPALFKLCRSGKDDEHAIEMLKKIDELREMLKFQELFRKQCHKLTTESLTPPAA